MTDDTNGGRPYGPTGTVDDLLGEEDRQVLSMWRAGNALMDPRYEAKGLRVLVGLSMTDEDVRARLLAANDDAQAQARIRAQADLPDGVTVRFVENTPDVLTVVLPPRAGTADRPTSLKDHLTSRTFAAGDLVTLGIGVDDSDYFVRVDADGGDFPHNADPSRDWG